MIPFYWNQITQIDSNSMLIDVRTEKENQVGTIPNSINIPVDELRNNLHRIDKTKAIYIFCAVGLRGYLAQRILMQNGFHKVYNLSGGYSSWKNCNAELEITSQESVIAEF